MKIFIGILITLTLLLSYKVIASVMMAIRLKKTYESWEPLIACIFWALIWYLTSK